MSRKTLEQRVLSDLTAAFTGESYASGPFEKALNRLICAAPLTAPMLAAQWSAINMGHVNNIRNGNPAHIAEDAARRVARTICFNYQRDGQHIPVELQKALG